MIKNYFLLACRNFWRNKIFSLINILSLSIGISAALVIFLIVFHEYSYDRFEPGRDRIYRVVLDASFSGVKGHSSGIPAPIGDAVQKEVTGIDLTVPVFQFQRDATADVAVMDNSAGKPVIYKGQKDIIFTSPSYFRLLPFKWIAGSPEKSLQEPFGVVLTESRARQYFPQVPLDQIIGKQVTYNENIPVTVTGIVKDLKENTIFTSAEFISYATIFNTRLKQDFMMTTWNDWMAYSHVFVKLGENTPPQRAESQMNALFKKHNTDDKPGGSRTTSLRLQPLGDVHFNHDYYGVGIRMAHKPTLYGLLVVAGFLLILGCINFINLSTAQSARRAKEIGVRKTMGSSKGQLIRQFLGETLFVTTIATGLSLLLTPILLKAFADLIPDAVRLDLFHQPVVPLFLLLLTLGVSFLAGLYPALILSGYNAVSALKNQAFLTRGQTRTAWIRRGLTVSQFVIAQFFIIGTLLVGKQIHYMQHKDLGFRKDAILTFEMPFDTVSRHRSLLLEEVKAIPEVELVSTGFLSPADKGASFGNMQIRGKENFKDPVQIRWGDSNYLKVYQIKLLAGRNIENTGNKEALINETYASEAGFKRPEDALNAQISFNGTDLSIVGVMRDFNQMSLKSGIMPLAFFGNTGSRFHIRLKPRDAGSDNWETGIHKIQNAWKQVYPDKAFSFAFVDETIATLYERERQTSRLLQWATGLMILISCLGLAGLVIYTTNSRTKEIGIRKVLGASVRGILALLSRDFLKLVLLAFVIATPLAWWASHKWLEDYAYRTTISWWVFALNITGIILFSLITLSFQTIRAAMANPVNSLRSE